MRVSDFHIWPQLVVHLHAVINLQVISSCRAVFGNKFFNCIRKRACVIFFQSFLKVRNLNQCFFKVVKVFRRCTDFLCKSGSKCHLKIPDRARKHSTVCIFIEIAGGKESVRIQGKLLQQNHLDKGFFIAVFVVMLSGSRMDSGVVSVFICCIYRIFEFLIVFADVLHRFLSDVFRTLYVEGTSGAGVEAIYFVDFFQVSFNQVAAGKVLRFDKAVCVYDLLFILVCAFLDLCSFTVGWILFFVCLFHVGDGNSGASHGVLLAEKVSTAVLAVIVKVDPVTICGVWHLKALCKIFKQLIVHLRGIAVPCK